MIAKGIMMMMMMMKKLKMNEQLGKEKTMRMCGHIQVAFDEQVDCYELAAKMLLPLRMKKRRMKMTNYYLRNCCFHYYHPPYYRC